MIRPHGTPQRRHTIVASPATIQAERDREWQQTRQYWTHVNIGALTVTNTAVAGVQVRIRTEGGSALASLHQRSIRHAVEDVAEVFAGRLSGKAYGAPVNNACNSLGGP